MHFTHCLVPWNCPSSGNQAGKTGSKCQQMMMRRMIYIMCCNSLHYLCHTYVISDTNSIWISLHLLLCQPCFVFKHFGLFLSGVEGVMERAA